MASWIDAFVPTLALIALGAALRARFLTKDEAWAAFERLTYWVLFPALLASSISTIRLAELPLGSMAAALWVSLGFGFAGALILTKVLGHGFAAMTSVTQGGVRFNTFVALALAAGLFGERGLAIGAVTAGLIVPCVQVIVTIVFALRPTLPPPQGEVDHAQHGGGGAELERAPRLDPARVFVQVLINPLFIACLVGFAFAAAGGMPHGLAPTAKILGQGSVALGLLCVGAALSLRTLAVAPLTQILVAAQKLVVLPAVTFALASAFRLDPLPAALATLFMAMPTASTGYIMARALGGDAKLMAAMIASQHVAALATVPVWVWVVGR
jgi:predicted permease